MANNQASFSASHIDIKKLALTDNSSTVFNNHSPLPRKNSENNEYYEEKIPDFPNHVKEALTTIKKFLSREESRSKIEITKDTIKFDGKKLEIDYEACKLCKSQHANLTCPQCERKVCSNCVSKRSNNIQCNHCKNTKRMKAKINSEFDEKIEKLLNLEKDDKIRELVLVEVENLDKKNLEELIAVVKKLEKKSDKLDREISITYFYVGKIFYEVIEKLYKDDDYQIEEQKARKILGSFRHAKDLEFGDKKMSINEIKEKLGANDTKLSRFFNLTLKIYLTYKGFDNSEEQMRKAERIPSVIWLRDLSQEKFLSFLEKLIQKREEIKEEV